MPPEPDLSRLADEARAWIDPLQLPCNRFASLRRYVDLDFAPDSAAQQDEGRRLTSAPRREPASRTFPLDLSSRGYQVLFRRGETNRCPGCGQVQWFVGRITAECVFCGTALPLAEAELAGFNPVSQKAVALHVVAEAESGRTGRERRREQRRSAEGRVIGLRLDGAPYTFALYNISAGGLLGDAVPGIADAKKLLVELEDGTLLPAELRWTDGRVAGLSFLLPHQAVPTST